jgi:hypothetical protein
VSYVEWLPPAKPFEDDDRGKTIAYLDAQSRIDLAVWAGYRHRAGGSVDHELVMRLVPPRPTKSRLRDLFWGVSYGLAVHAYVGFPTRPQMRGAREVGDVVWERSGAPPPGADPLDFRIVEEPVELTRDVRAAIRQIGKLVPVVCRIRVGLSTLLKSGAVMRQSVQGRVECEGDTEGIGSGPVGALADVLRTQFKGVMSTGVSMAAPTRRSGLPIVYARRSLTVEAV